MTAEALLSRVRAHAGVDDVTTVLTEADVEALDVLAASYVADADLTVAGWEKVVRRLGDALAARARTEAAWRAAPEHAQVPVERPIVVTGLPRSGTTALHRLLCADPRHQGLELWLAAAPQPRPPRAMWDGNADHRRMAKETERRNAAVPGLKGLHFMSPDSVEECWWLDRQTFRSWSFPSVAPLPSYAAWLAEQDLTPGYRHHRRILQLIGSTQPERRWVLKNPGHLFALDALLAAYPDALVVQTHRDPRATIASVSSLTARSSAGTSTTFTAERIGPACLELWATGAERFREARARHDPARFVDVAYDDLVADPVSTVARIYAAGGLANDDAARSAVEADHAASRRGDRRPDHDYSLAEFGLTDEDVARRFAPR
jgi:hypothetical protein